MIKMRRKCFTGFFYRMMSTRPKRSRVATARLIETDQPSTASTRGKGRGRGRAPPPPPSTPASLAAKNAELEETNHEVGEVDDKVEGADGDIGGRGDDSDNEEEVVPQRVRRSKPFLDSDEDENIDDDDSDKRDDKESDGDNDGDTDDMDDASSPPPLRKRRKRVQIPDNSEILKVCQDQVVLMSKPSYFNVKTKLL